MTPAARTIAIFSLLAVAAGDWTTVSHCRVHDKCGTKGGEGCGQGRSCLTMITTAAEALRKEFGSNNPEAGFSDGQTLCYIAIRAAAEDCRACEACDNALIQMSEVNTTLAAKWLESHRRGGVSGVAATALGAACALALLAAAVQGVRAIRAVPAEARQAAAAEDKKFLVEDKSTEE